MSVVSISRSESIKSIALALSKAQAEFPAPPKRKTANVPTKAGGSYSYKYADLADVIDAVKPTLAKYELSVAQPMRIAAEGFVLTTVLMHSSGEFLESDYLLPNRTERPQEMGAAITYGRRYALCALLGVAADEDVDGQEGSDDGDQDDGDLGSYMVKIGMNNGKRLREIPADVLSRDIAYWGPRTSQAGQEYAAKAREFLKRPSGKQSA